MASSSIQSCFYKLSIPFHPIPCSLSQEPFPLLSHSCLPTWLNYSYLSDFVSLPFFCLYVNTVLMPNYSINDWYKQLPLTIALESIFESYVLGESWKFGLIRVNRPFRINHSLSALKTRRLATFREDHTLYQGASKNDNTQCFSLY